jgi:predicted pyridoxine 5'-phosphate oxidase superfamily flavin-nucleotide-binding protein
MPSPPISGASAAGSPFHEGERAVQERLGVREKIEPAGRRMIRDFMPDQHRAFFEGLPYIVVATLDERGRVWPSMLAGRPGFVSSPDSRTLLLSGLPAPGDRLRAGLHAGAPVGVLGIDLATRRRNRANGTVTRSTEDGLAIEVSQSFGNCPKYIQLRRPELTREPTLVPTPERVSEEGPSLSPRARALVERADTFFLASASPIARAHDALEGVDVSHRGGMPGFVRIGAEERNTVMTFPDYRGNNMYNSLGNVVRNERVGLLFVDFDDGSLLSLVGRAVILWGPERAVRVTVEEGTLQTKVLPLRWKLTERAPEFAAEVSGE